MRRPPLRTIADLAGVSEPTVSRVLNGKPGVAERTRLKVVEALQALGYDAVPEPRPDRRNVIGILCGDFLNPVFPTIIHHLSNGLARKGFVSTIAVSDPDLASEPRCVDELLHNRVSGMIFVNGNHAEIGSDRSHYRRLTEAEMPVVFVNGADTGLAAPHVWCDEEAGARKAVNHLVQLGHERIGGIVGPGRYVPTDRFVRGYRAAMAEHGLPAPDSAVVTVPFTVEGGRAGAARLIADGVTAAFAGNDLMALGALLAAEAMDRPFSSIGYDGTEFTGFSNPPLTTLRQPFREMADMAVNELLATLAAGTPRRELYVFEPELVVRESTRPLRNGVAIG